MASILGVLDTGAQLAFRRAQLDICQLAVEQTCMQTSWQAMGRLRGTTPGDEQSKGIEAPTAALRRPMTSSTSSSTDGMEECERREV